MRLWFRRSQPAIDDPTWAAVQRRAALLRQLDPEQLQRLRTLSERFLRRKTIQAVAGLELDATRRCLIAALCSLPLLRLPDDWLDDWHEVIVYPGQFRVRRHDYDEASGVIAEWDDELAGESWERGPLVLSWADVRADLRRPREGYNVVVHEIAHKLDGLDGVLDGTPPLSGALRADWVRACQAAFDDLCTQVDAGHEPPIDAYAAEAEDEFFAVVSEYHYSAPDVLAAAYPDVAAVLSRFYGPSPWPASATAVAVQPA